MKLSPQEHLERAESYVKMTQTEKAMSGGGELSLRASQGAALRGVIFHGFAAVVEAIRERPVR